MKSLAAARTLAWALWLGGWLVLGGFGHQHLPLLAGGLAPLALWLLCIGALLALPRPLPPPALALCLVAGALLAAAGLLWQQALPLATGWALLLVEGRLFKRPFSFPTAPRTRQNNGRAAVGYSVRSA